METKDRIIIKSFIKFAQKELGIKTLPKFKFTASHPADVTQGKYQTPGLIVVCTKDRQIADICRTTGHELVHHWQAEKGKLKSGVKIPDIGGPIEDEANALAGRLVKKFGTEICPMIYETYNLMEEKCKLKHADLTAKDLAIRHSMFIGTMEKEIEAGIKVEKEHTDDEEIARGIALAHIYEFPDYYTNKEFGLKANEKKLEKENESVLKRLETILKENLESGTNVSVTDETPETVKYDVVINGEKAGDFTINTFNPQFDKYTLEIIDFNLTEKHKVLIAAQQQINFIWAKYPDKKRIVISPADKSIEFWTHLHFEKMNNSYYYLLRPKGY